MRNNIFRAIKQMTAEEFMASPPNIIDTMGVECIIVAMYQAAIRKIVEDHPEVKTFGDLANLKDVPQEVLLKIEEIPDKIRIQSLFAITMDSLKLGAGLMHEIAASYNMAPFSIEDTPMVIFALGIGRQHTIFVPMKEVHASVICLTFEPEASLEELTNQTLCDTVRHELQHYFQMVRSNNQSVDITELSSIGKENERYAMASMFGGFFMRDFVQTLFKLFDKREEAITQLPAHPDVLKTLSEEFYKIISEDVFNNMIGKLHAKKEAIMADECEELKSLSHEYYNHLIQRWIDGKVKYLQNGFAIPNREGFKAVSIDSEEGLNIVNKLKDIKSKKCNINDFLDKQEDWSKPVTKNPDQDVNQWKGFKPPTGDANFGLN